MKSTSRLGAASALACAMLLSAAPCAAADTEAPPAITVDGEGVASAVPDLARLRLAAQATGTDLPATQRSLDGVVRAFLSRARALGAADRDLTAAAVVVQPQYNESHGRQRFSGYRVTREIAVTVRNLARLGGFLAAATDAGVNVIDAPQLESSHALELERLALQRAALAARGNAAAIAESLHLRLGAARSITVQQAWPGPVQARAMAAGDGGGLAIAPGEIRYRATVRASFAIDGQVP